MVAGDSTESISVEDRDERVREDGRNGDSWKVCDLMRVLDDPVDLIALTELTNADPFVNENMKDISSISTRLIVCDFALPKSG